MKKSISILLCLLLVFGLSLNLSAQNGEELDQVELLKQFIGTWEADFGNDTVVVFIFTPINNGLHFVMENKANGETYQTQKGVYGFSDDKQIICAAWTNPGGRFVIDKGRFETKTKLIIERYTGNSSHAYLMGQWDFLTPDSFVIHGMVRGDEMTWPTDWFEWGIAKKVK
jgi:hypothetical protein